MAHSVHRLLEANQASTTNPKVVRKEMQAKVMIVFLFRVFFFVYFLLSASPMMKFLIFRKRSVAIVL